MLNLFFRPQKPQVFGRFETTVKISLARGDESWTERCDLLESLSRKLLEAGHPSKRKGKWIRLRNGILLHPELTDFKPNDPNGMRTSTRIAIAHKSRIRESIFEYQHSNGADTRNAIEAGFASWIEFDLPVLLDLLKTENRSCTQLTMTYTTPVLKREVLLGKAAHTAFHDQKVDEEHPFCPCCLFTNTIEAFKPYLQNDKLYAIRLFAARDAEGAVSADCRINGHDYELGNERLLAYAKTWPDRGFEIRKQYIAIQTISTPREVRGKKAEPDS